MEATNQRFREVRKLCKKTQEEWGKIIGITRAGVTDIEAGRRNVTDKHLIALDNYKEYLIDTNWIRTGEGEPFKKRTRTQEIGYFVNEIMDAPDDNFKKRFIAALARLDEKDWEALSIIVDKISKEG